MWCCDNRSADAPGDVEPPPIISYEAGASGKSPFVLAAGDVWGGNFTDSMNASYSAYIIIEGAPVIKEQQVHSDHYVPTGTRSITTSASANKWELRRELQDDDDYDFDYPADYHVAGTFVLAKLQQSEAKRIIDKVKKIIASVTHVRSTSPQRNNRKSSSEAEKHRFAVGEKVWIRQAKVGWKAAVVKTCEMDEFKGYTLNILALNDESEKAGYYIGCDTDWHIRREKPTDEEEAALMSQSRCYDIGADVEIQVKSHWTLGKVTAHNVRSAAYEVSLWANEAKKVYVPCDTLEYVRPTQIKH